MTFEPTVSPHLMPVITCHMSVSLDGFVAGPHQSRNDPVGVGGIALHQ
jgi:hypothetical protein